MFPLHPVHPTGTPRAGLCDRRGKGMGDASEDCRAAAFLPQQRDLSVFFLVYILQSIIM